MKIPKSERERDVYICNFILKAKNIRKIRLK